MAIYYCKIHSVKRSSGGNSAVKKAAYNSGDELHDNEQDKTFKFDKPEVIESKIVLPQNAAERFKDRATLWNAAQKAEKSVTGNLAREFVIAIPRELNQDQARKLTDDFARVLVRQGMCVDYSIHWKENNPHAHILATTRLLDKNGEFAPIKEKKVLARDKDGNKIPLLDENGKQRVRVRAGHGVEKLWKRETVLENSLNNGTNYQEWRQSWQDCANAALAQIGSNERINCLSYKKQGLDIIPQIHEGRAAREIEKRGGISEKCQINRNIRSINEQSRALKEKKAALENELNLNKNQSEKVYKNWETAVAENPAIKNQQMTVANTIFNKALAMKNYKIPQKHINRKMIDATLKVTPIKVKDNKAIPSFTIPTLPTIFKAMFNEYKMPNHALAIQFAELSSAIKSAELSKDYDRVFALINAMKEVAENAR